MWLAVRRGSEVAVRNTARRRRTRGSASCSALNSTSADLVRRSFSPGASTTTTTNFPANNGDNDIGRLRTRRGRDNGKNAVPKLLERGGDPSTASAVAGLRSTPLRRRRSSSSRDYWHDEAERLLITRDLIDDSCVPASGRSLTNSSSSSSFGGRTRSWRNGGGGDADITQQRLFQKRRQHKHDVQTTFIQQQLLLSEFRSLQQSSYFSTQATEEEKKTTKATKTKGASTKPAPSPRLGRTKVPSPDSLAPPPDPSALDKLRKTTPKGVLHKGMDLTVSLFKSTVRFAFRLPGNIFYYITHPDDLKQAIADIKQRGKDEINHYWVGFKLLWADMQTARNLVSRTLQGSALTRRERNQLLRTVTDLFRLIPFSMFLIIPFMEFALPFALMLFPNMLPSTFQDSLKSEENMKRELQSRIAMAHFFQETMAGLANEQKRKATKRKKELAEAGVCLEEAGDTIKKQEDSAASMVEFLEKARSGEMIPPDVIIRYANYFHDDLTLDNMPRMQLINMCKYMGISPYGSEAFLRFQLRHRIRVLKEDDQRILWEGIDSLTKMELREACQERGMRSTGLSKDAYKRSLQQWLDLSVNKNVPISLLIMSRTFFLRDETVERKVEDEELKSVAGLADAISGLDKDVVDQVILEVATPEEKTSDPDITKLKLEVVFKQNELIRQEQEEREAATKRKETEKSSEIPPAEDLPADEEAVAAAKATPEAEPPVEFVDSAGTEHYETPEPEEKEEERDLSTEEMDAISQLMSDDPVSKERAELEKIKAAMKAEVSADSIPADEGVVGEPEEPSQPAARIKIDIGAPIDVEALHEKVAKEAAATVVSDVPEAGVEATDLTLATENVPAADGEEGEVIDAEVVEEEEEEEEDPVVAKLKKRIESMVDKIEGQLSQVQVKIGDKLHFLDKDKDGVLSPEEMAGVLQQVLKRKITKEEATEIASAMDSNKDGFITVDELIHYLDEHKLVKYVQEGRDADLDRIMESHSSGQPPKDESNDLDQKPKDESVANK